MEETSALSKPDSDGHVLVHFYGNLPRYGLIYFPDWSFLVCLTCLLIALNVSLLLISAWIDPMTDISTFEEVS